MQKAPPTPKGFRDIAKDKAKNRRETIDKIAKVLEENSFEPLETPTIEFAETLTGKYGEEERLIYKFKDRGDRELALRYDLTVPLARFIANNQNLIAKGPYRRYQIGQVFRGENPQAGRYREFTQFDFDTVGSAEIDEDVKIIETAIKAAKRAGLSKAVMAINDRNNFSGIPVEVVRSFDKLHKIGETGVREEIKKNGFSQTETDQYLNKLLNSKETELINNIFGKLRHCQTDNNEPFTFGHEFYFDSSLARGLDYYTGAIFELKSGTNPREPSIGAGGRYDNLIGMFAGKPIPAVGFSFGVDRLVEAVSGK